MGQQSSYPSATFQLSVPVMRPQNAFTCTVGTTFNPARLTGRGWDDITHIRHGVWPGEGQLSVRPGLWRGVPSVTGLLSGLPAQARGRLP